MTTTTTRAREVRPWLKREHDEVCRRYMAGERVRDIAAALGRSERSVRAVIEREKVRRQKGCTPKPAPRANAAWPRVKAALEQRPMSRAEIIEATGLGKGHALRALTEHHGHDVHICRWVRSARRPVAIFALGPGRDALKPAPITEAKRVRRVNPFAVAAGLVAAPQGHRGRVFAQPMDVEGWETTKRRAA